MNPVMPNAGGANKDDHHLRLKITHVDAFGPYLKIFGQTHPETVTAITISLRQMLPTCFTIDPSWSASKQQALLLPGTLCICKRSGIDELKGLSGSSSSQRNLQLPAVDLLRARVANFVTQKTMLQVEVELIDYGLVVLVSSTKLFFPEYPLQLKHIPPQCTQYVMLGVCTDWKRSDLDEISRMIVNQTLDVCIEMEVQQWRFVTMKWKEFKFSEFLIHQKKIGAPIANDLLRDNFVKIAKQQQQEKTNGVLPHHSQNSNNNNSNGSYVNNNNNLIYSNNNNATTAEIRQPDFGQKRPLNARLLPRHPRLSHQSMLGPSQQPIQPRLPHNSGNLRSLIQGIHNQNSRMSYTGLNMQLPLPLPSLMDASKPMLYPSATPEGTATTSPATSNQVRPRIVSPPTPSYAINRNATFKTHNLTAGSVYDVYVSFVENGPYLFSVQLATAEQELTEMMEKIERLQLRPFGGVPAIGNACIARYAEDKNMYRAMITKVIQPGNVCKVSYIDYGNSAVVQYHDLFDIPVELLNSKAFGLRFTLSGAKELEPIDESLKKAFKDLVMYQHCRLKVMPLEGPPVVQYCELYMQNKNILEVLKQIQKSRLVYSKAENLKNDDIVEIRYIDSPNHFYVQKVSNIPEFEQLMDEMYLYYNANQVVPSHLNLGAPCIVKFDNEWYRAEVMRADLTAIVVRHVDFGYEQKVTRNLLSTIAEKHLKLPRQAVQCCLKGFENNDKHLATTQFEMLAEESNLERRAFSVKVFRIQPDGVNLINLFTKDLNIMKKLFKLSMPFEQYLKMEKEDFNFRSQSPLRVLNQRENGNKTPSITSSNDMSSVHSSKKSANTALLNSPPLLRVDQQLQRQRNPDKGAGQMRQRNNLNSIEFDKSSYASSTENRDSQSNTSEAKSNQSGRQQGRNQRAGGKNSPQNANANSERSANDLAYNSHNNHNNNSKQQTVPSSSPTGSNENHRRNKMTGSPGQQNQRAARPQNAPQGYSQPRSKGGNSPDQIAIVRSYRNNNNATRLGSNANNNNNEQEAKPVEEYVPLTQAFNVQPLQTPLREDVVICWWISPHQFYTHLKSRIPAFERMMQEMQLFYKRKAHQQLQLRVGSHVVARNRKENTICRARIIGCNQMQRKYKVFNVDFGSQYTVSGDDIWPVEKRFADLPAMAYQCSFEGILSNYDHLYIIDQMEKYLPGNASLTCDYFKREQDLYLVNIFVNNVPLKETLKKEGLITEIGSGLRLNLLSGQQIRAKIISVRDMLNFKIQFEACDKRITCICSYDDVRFVKSNADIVKKFRQFYENKTLVLNIKDVNDNKVVLLRPLMPLLKDDIATSICTYPIIFESYEAKVVNVASGYRVHIHLVEHLPKIDQLKENMNAFYKSKTGGNQLQSVEIEQFCAALASDGNWYRGRTIEPNKNSTKIKVFFIDYGKSETIERGQLRQLDEKFSIGTSAYAIEVNLPLRMSSSDQQQRGRGGNEGTVINELKKLVLDQTVVVKTIEVRKNRLIADIVLSNQKNLVDALKEKQLIRGRDLDYMRKQIEKEQANMLEYIEMVDLTIEDEEDEKKVANKSKTSSPRKKKSQRVEQRASEGLNESASSNELMNMADGPKDESKKAEEKSQLATVAPDAAVVDDIIEVAPPNAVARTFEEIKSSTPIPPAQLEAETEQELEPEPEKAVAPQMEAEAEPQLQEPDRFAHMEQAVLSHCDNPAQFFVHPYEKLADLHKLQENLQIVAGSLPPLMNVINGAHCISHFSVDKNWYRAKLLDAELMVLKFIDFGNTDCVSDTSNIREMSVFPDIEPMCMPCALPIKPNGTADWVDAANTIFNESYEKMLYYEYITRGDTYKRSFINLYIDGINVADKLVQDGYAKPLVVVESDQNCYISNVNGISDFSIQYEKDSKILELIEIYLEAYEKLPKLEKFEHSKIVAALFEDDEKWYRAKLLKQIPNVGYEVLFIDYGNTAVSGECREISEEIAMLPWLSKKCALELPDMCLNWSEEAEKKFNEIGVSETIFTVQLREPAAECAIVHLLVDGHNIIDDLAPLCEQKPMELDLNASFFNSTMHTSLYEMGKLYNATISHLNAPWDFYVQFNKDTIRREDITGSLSSLGLDNLEQLKEFSLHCTLENADKLKQHEHEALELFKVLIALSGKQMKIDLIDSTVDPTVVKLYTFETNENLCEKLNLLLGLDTDLNQLNAASPRMCLISHSVSSQQFFIQHKVSLPKLELLRKYLELNKDKFPAIDVPKIGCICAAYSSEDDCFMRGRIEAVNGDAYDVFTLDYGNRIMAKKFIQLPQYWCEMPGLAIECALKTVPNGANKALVERCFATLMEAYFGEMYQVEEDEIDTENGKHRVKLLVNYKDLSEQLMTAVKKSADDANLNDAANDDVVQSLCTPNMMNCILVQVNSPTSFYIQLDADISEIANITDILLDAERDFAELQDVHEGAICAAQFPDDEAYYRAKITKVLENGQYEVHFIDFGNNSVTQKLRKLPDNLLSIEPYSKHCSLESIMLTWSPEACTQFQALIDSRFSETFQVEFLKSDSDPIICRLFYQDKNVTAELAQSLLKRVPIVKASTLGSTNLSASEITSSEPTDQPSSNICNNVTGNPSVEAAPGIVEQ